MSTAEPDESEAPKARRKQGRVDPRIAQTRELVFASTLELLAERGAGGVTIEKIAERSGVARSTIYRRWPDLATLYLEAFERIVRRRPLPPSEGDLEGQLRAYLHDYADRLNDPTYFSILVALIEWGWRNPQFAEAQRNFFDERQSRAAELVRAGQQTGTIRGDIDVRSGMKAIEAPFLHTRMIDNELITPQEIGLVLAELLERFTPHTGEDDGAPRAGAREAVPAAEAAGPAPAD